MASYLMIEIEYVGGPLDGIIETHEVEKPSKWFTKKSHLGYVKNGDEILHVEKYILVDEKNGPKGYIRAKYLLTQQYQEVIINEDNPKSQNTHTLRGE